MRLRVSIDNSQKFFTDKVNKIISKVFINNNIELVDIWRDFLILYSDNKILFTELVSLGSYIFNNQKDVNANLFLVLKLSNEIFSKLINTQTTVMDLQRWEKQLLQFSENI